MRLGQMQLKRLEDFRFKQRFESRSEGSALADEGGARCQN
jgi:hypothetical protein